MMMTLGVLERLGESAWKLVSPRRQQLDLEVGDDPAGHALDAGVGEPEGQRVEQLELLVDLGGLEEELVLGDREEEVEEPLEVGEAGRGEGEGVEGDRRLGDAQGVEQLLLTEPLPRR